MRKRTVTDEQIEEIRKLREEGLSYGKIGQMCGIRPGLALYYVNSFKENEKRKIKSIGEGNIHCCFYHYQKGNRVNCEDIHLSFDTAEQRAEYMQKYCCNIRKCEQCENYKKIMQKYM